MKTFEVAKDAFLKKTWQFTYDRKMSHQRMKLFHHGYCVEIPKFFGVKIDSEVYRVKAGNVSVYYEKNDHEKAFANILAMISGSDSTEWIRKIEKTIRDSYEIYIKDINERPSNYEGISGSELIQVYKSFCRLNDMISLPTWLLYLYFEEVLTSALRKALSQKSGLEKAEEVISTISKPSVMTPLDSYTIDLCNASISKGEDRDNKIRQIAKKYDSWGFYDVNYELPTLAFHKDKVEKMDSATAERNINELNARYLSQSAGVIKIKEEWKGEENISAMIDLYTYYSDFKDWKNFYRERSSLKLRPLLEKIGSILSLTLEQVSFMTEEEIVDALSGSEHPDAGEIDSRVSNSAFVYLENKLIILTDEKELSVVDQSLSVINSSSITGTSAYSGIVKGKVLIVSSTEDFSKMQDGDILVASTTRPDYLPFMKKAGGFITNEGGLLSHAAILARELKKPCIIGTKIATKVLKDGDMVEVDANTGLVRIIK